jgi:RNA polymerase primary sigma factor
MTPAGYGRRETDGIQDFLNAAGKIPLLTHDEEILLGRRVQARQELLADNPKGPYSTDERRVLRTGERAKDRMVTANLRLVVNIAKRYIRVAQHLGLDDLIQEGMFGLVRGVEKFDPERGYKFSTYAYWWIRQSISRAISQQDRTIRLPVNAINCLNKLRLWMPQFFREHGRMPSPQECADHVEVTLPVMRHYLQHLVGTISLDQQCRTDENASFILEMVASSDTSPMDALEISDGIQAVGSWLGALSEQQAAVMSCRFGLDGNGPRTQKSTSVELGVSRQAVQQAEQRSLRKMRLQALRVSAA